MKFDILNRFSGKVQFTADIDHRCLNEVDGLANPTAENIAIWIWDRVKLNGMSRVRVYETANCWAEYAGQ